MSAERRPLSPEEIGQIQARAQARVGGTLYDVLGVPTDATTQQVEASYHDVARQWHPDRFYSRDTGLFGSVIEENFVAATQAYRTLRDATRRSAYDREAGIAVRPAATAAPRGAASTPAGGPAGAAPVAASASARVPGGGAPGAPGAGGASAAARPVAPVSPPRPRSAAVEKMRQHIAEQVARARQYYQAGKEDFEAGRYVKAEGALYLALQFDPRHPEAAALLPQAQKLAREARAAAFVAQAQQEEAYGRAKEAMALYEKAAECDPPKGEAFYRLGQLALSSEQDARAAVNWFRKAVQKEPGKAAYRMALAETYEQQGLAANAVREAQAVLASDARNEAAKAMLKRLRA